MFERLLGWVLRIIKVPPEPRPPAGDKHILRVFRAAPNFWRYKLVLWAIAQVSAMIGLFFGFGLAGLVAAKIPNHTIAWVILSLEYIGWLTFIAQLPFGYALLRLDFDMRWYMLTDRSMHLRHGTLRLEEKTITYANVQNITIRQNPLQRLLGIADVNVRTAGGGDSSMDEHGNFSSMHEARFHGVDNPEEIRDAIRERVRLYRDAGLGDADDSVQPLPARSSALQAAREVLAEVKALRTELPQ